MKLLEEKQVVVVPGDAFGQYGDGYVRLSFAASMDHIKKGLDLIEEFLNDLQKRKAVPCKLPSAVFQYDEFYRIGHVLTPVTAFLETLVDGSPGQQCGGFRLFCVKAVYGFRVEFVTDLL